MTDVVAARPQSRPEPRPGAPPARFSLRLSRWDWTALGLVLVLGLINLPQPFGWDQAMFTVGARSMQHGAVLYRDYWDVKQPGLFWFYQAAGALFGFSEVGIHVFELLTMLGFSLLLLVGLRRSFSAPWGPAAAVTLTVGYYFAVCTDWHLTQIEGLVNAPLFLCAWASGRGVETGRTRWWLVAGIAGGLAIVAKLVLFPVVALIGLPALIAAARAPAAERRGGWIRPALLALTGIAIPVLATALYFVAHRSLALAWWTTIDYPIHAMRQVEGFRIKPLRQSVAWFASNWSPLILLSMLGVFAAVRGASSLLSRQLLLWTLGAAFVILMQRWSYWPYQFLLFVTPLGVFAALGLEAFAPAFAHVAPRARPYERAVLAALMLIVFFITPIGAAARKARVLAQHRFALDAPHRTAYQIQMSMGNGYRRILGETEFLRAPGGRAGSIYVLGNALYYWLSGRDQAIPRNGASFIESFTREEWQHVTDSLVARRPPYIFFQPDYREIVAAQGERSRSLFELIARDYRPLRTSQAGTWYELSAP